MPGGVAGVQPRGLPPMPMGTRPEAILDRRHDIQTSFIITLHGVYAMQSYHNKHHLSINKLL